MLDEPLPSFQSAASYLSTSSSLAQTPTSTKLELYGLFKYVTVSPTPNISRPSIFDMTGRAKWDAWNSVGKKHPTKDAAQSRYIEIAKQLGWSEKADTAKAQDDRQSDDGLRINEGDDAGVHSTENISKGGVSGLGVSVSKVEQPPDDNDGTIHGLAIAGDLEGLRTHLDQPTMDINGRDEFEYTPLHLAADRGHLEVVQLLLKRGADPSLKDQDGLLPHEIAQVAGHQDIVDILIASVNSQPQSNV